MTTGSKTSGSTTGPGNYFYKSWSGTDGKYDASHRIKFNPYTVTVKTAKLVSSSSGYIQTPNFSVYFGWSNNDELELLSRLADQARGHSFNLGVAIGEGKETIELLVGTASRFYRSIRALKHGHFGNAARELGISAPHRHSRRKASDPRKLNQYDISSQWLELQYGWLPLLGDVHEAAKAFSAIADKQRSLTFTVSSTKSGFNSHWESNCTFVTSTEKRTKKYFVTLQEPLGARASLGLVDPASVAWELTPFSFVADWFIPVGTYLDALATIPRLNMTATSSLRYQKTGSVAYVSGSGCGYINDLYWAGSVSTSTYKYYQRYGSTGIVVPYPEFHISDALRSNRVWNAISLLHQMVK